jgi:hypothetical protein
VCAALASRGQPTEVTVRTRITAVTPQRISDRISAEKSEDFRPSISISTRDTGSWTC